MVGHRYWAGGIRPDKTTTSIVGVSLGLAIGAALEYSQVALGHVASDESSASRLFALLGGFLALVSRPFLVRKGRFQFGLKSLFALTAVWALIFGLLSPNGLSYQSETEAMSSLAALLGGPVRCREPKVWSAWPMSILSICLPARSTMPNSMRSLPNSNVFPG